MQTYRRLDQSVLLEMDNQLLFQQCVDNISQSLGDEFDQENFAGCLLLLPCPARSVWYAWKFASEVAGNGFIGYLGNGSASCQDIREAKAALSAVGATQLLSMLNAGIHLAEPFEPPFWAEPGIAILCAESPKGEDWQSLEDMDDQAMSFAAAPLTDLVAAYIRANAQDL